MITRTDKLTGHSLTYAFVQDGGSSEDAAEAYMIDFNIKSKATAKAQLFDLAMGGRSNGDYSKFVQNFKVIWGRPCDLVSVRPTVQIAVRGGIAEIESCPDDVEVQINDYDNAAAF